MSKYFKYFDEIDPIPYTDYFLNTFIKENNFIEEVKKGITKSYIIYDANCSSMITALSNELSKKYKYPAISHFLLFYHTSSQSIHSDGYPIIRQCSFNLPVLGWEGTQMNFYTEKSNVASRNEESRYYQPYEVDIQERFDCHNKWVLVNSGLPHNVCNMTEENPRITVVTRFHSNPSFEMLLKLSKIYDYTRLH
jgi:hypothetical protein